MPSHCSDWRKLITARLTFCGDKSRRFFGDDGEWGGGDGGDDGG